MLEQTFDEMKNAHTVHETQTENELTTNSETNDKQALNSDFDEKSTNKVQRKKRSQKNSVAVTDEIRKKVSEALKEMSQEIVKRTVEQKPAEILIRDNLEHIDKMSKDGATLAQIFERINKVFKLNISVASFGIYVRRIRTEMNSELAPKPRVKRTKKTSGNEVKTNSATNNETNNENNGFVCEQCELTAQRIESKKKPGTFFWHCLNCKTYYKDDDNSLTKVKLNAKQ